MAKLQAFLARLVHWFRFRFDIGYRIELELERWEQEKLAHHRICNAEMALQAPGAFHGRDLFKAIMDQLNGVD